MHSLDGNLITAALQRSLVPNGKKKTNNFDDHIIASARRVLSTKIEYVHCPQYSATKFLEKLKSKYTVLKSNKERSRKAKKRKRNKQRQSENSANQMKNTELSGQDQTLPEPKVILFSPDDVQLGWRGNLPVGSGFVNLGTTCYINSTLQALFHVPSFVNWLMEDRKHHAACEKMNGMLHTECLVCAMSKTLQTSHRLSGGSYRPRQIIEKVKSICKHLSPFRQEDAHEFLRYLMEAMEKSYIAILGIQAKKLDSFSKETTPLSQIFGGYIRTEVTCLECSHVSTTFQHFQDLILDIRQASTSTVFDALENYFSKERLDGDEAYHCEHCKKKVSAYKKFSVEKAPNALCIQLKRFNISSFYGGSKLSKLINIPQTIDLSKFKHKKGTPNGVSLKYRLVSMVFHHGPSAYSGHYTALGCTSGGSYYYFNDDQVYATHLGQYTNNPNAYIMFYEREKPVTSENSLSLKIVSTHSISPSSLSNGCANGSGPQRTNGFFKRENSFSSSNNYYTSRPSWELNNNHTNNNNGDSKVPLKSVNIVSSSTATTSSNGAKSSSTSLVPYMNSGSESDDSDCELLMPKRSSTTDSNNNSRATNELHSTPSSLAKKNSTLTSLLATSPKSNDSSAAGASGSSAYRLSPSLNSSSSSSSCSSSSVPLKNGASRSDEQNEDAKSSPQSTNEAKPPEKRGFIPFNIFNRCKLKENVQSKDASSDSNKVGSGSSGCSNGNVNNDTGPEEPKSKSVAETLVGFATSYLPGSSKKESGVEEKAKVNGANGQETTSMSNGDASHAERVRANGLANGVDRTSTTTTNSGVGKVATNGWIVTDIDDACSGGAEKNGSPSKLMRGEWIVTEKSGHRTVSSPTKSNEIRENGKKCNSNGNDCKIESSRNEYNNLMNSFSHSSQNGYGGKVMTWNGDLSHINREAEQERKEALKRSHEYDDEQDRGKVKKMKQYNRNENHSNSQSPRKNPIQQHHNHFNHMNQKRAWAFQQNNHHYTRRFNGHNHADFYRSNNNNNNNNNNNHHHHYGYRHASHVNQQRYRR